MERIYLAMGPNSYGKGLSAEEAKRTCLNFGLKKGDKVKVFLMPEGAYNVRVDGLGRVHWDLLPDANQDQDMEEIE